MPGPAFQVSASGAGFIVAVQWSDHVPAAALSVGRRAI